MSMANIAKTNPGIENNGLGTRLFDLCKARNDAIECAVFLHDAVDRKSVNGLSPPLSVAKHFQQIFVEAHPAKLHRVL